MVGSGDEEEWERVSRVERSCLSAYEQSKSRHDRAFRKDEGYGEEAPDWRNGYLSTAISQIRGNCFCEVTGSTAIAGAIYCTTNLVHVIRGGRGSLVRAQ